MVRAKQLFPEYAGVDSPSWYLAQIYRQRGARAQAVAELEALTAINAGHYPALLALAALRDSLGQKAQAARALGLQRTYLLRLMREFGVNVPRQAAHAVVQSRAAAAAGERQRAVR